MNNFTFSTAELIDILGVSRKTITNYVRAGMPKLGHGRFHLLRALQWFTARLRANKANLSLEEVREQLYQAQTEKLHCEIAQAKRQLVPYEEAAGVLNEVAQIIESRAAGVNDPSRHVTLHLEAR